MPSLNLECSICKDSFHSSDDIHSTSCGHIFHESCLRYWQAQSTNCAQCRCDYPTTHKLYITLDDSNSSNSADTLENSTNELNMKLKNATDEIRNLYNQIQQIEEQYAISQELIKDLDRKINQSNDSETTCILLQEQYIESEDLIRELEKKIQCLSIKNQSKSKELTLKSLEIQKLKTSLETAKSQAYETEELSLLNYLDFRREQEDMRSLVVNDFPLDKIINPLDKTIIKLASKMGLTISRGDLNEVYIIQCCPQSLKVSLCVRFKRLDLKISFLSRNSRLQRNSSYEFIQIRDYVDETS